MLCVLASFFSGMQYVPIRALGKLGNFNWEMLIGFNFVAVLSSATVMAIVPSQQFFMPPYHYGEIGVICIVAIAGMIVQAGLNYASRRVEGGIVAMMTTVDIVWAYLWQMLVFREAIDSISIFGSVLVMMAVAALSYYKVVTSRKQRADARRIVTPEFMAIDEADREEEKEEEEEGEESEVYRNEGAFTSKRHITSTSSGVEMTQILPETFVVENDNDDGGCSSIDGNDGDEIDFNDTELPRRKACLRGMEEGEYSNSKYHQVSVVVQGRNTDQ
mmetsp:Transcript_31487/g.51150  ORF Transcript_31487/g.51150 Transcript_31487/m.51150 type:complete len:274 (+) Transcript_31487:736-1557(+)